MNCGCLILVHTSQDCLTSYSQILNIHREIYSYFSHFLGCRKKTLTELACSFCKTVPNFKKSTLFSIDLIINTHTGNTYSYCVDKRTECQFFKLHPYFIGFFFFYNLLFHIFQLLNARWFNYLAQWDYEFPRKIYTVMNTCSVNMTPPPSKKYGSISIYFIL